MTIFVERVPCRFVKSSTFIGWYIDVVYRQLSTDSIVSRDDDFQSVNVDWWYSLMSIFQWTYSLLLRPLGKHNVDGWLIKIRGVGRYVGFTPMWERTIRAGGELYLLLIQWLSTNVYRCTRPPATVTIPHIVLSLGSKESHIQSHNQN